MSSEKDVKKEPVKRGRKKIIIDKPKKEEEESFPFPADLVPPLVISSSRSFSLNESQNETIREYVPCLTPHFVTTTAIDKPQIIVMRHEDTPPAPWPDSTDLCCWNDGHPFTNIPWFAPLKKHGEYFIMEGIFCSFACTARYIRDVGGFYSDMRISMLVDIAQRYFGMKIADMIIAPNRHILGIYSGNGMTIETYRSEKSHVTKRLPPFIPACVMFERQRGNNNIWTVRGIRVPNEVSVEKIYMEEHVDGVAPYPGKPSLYDKFYEKDKIKEKEITTEFIKPKSVEKNVDTIKNAESSTKIDELTTIDEPMKVDDMIKIDESIKSDESTTITMKENTKNYKTVDFVHKKTRLTKQTIKKSELQQPTIKGVFLRSATAS